MQEVALIDTGHANLRSVERALLAAAAQSGTAARITRTHEPNVIARADKIVVPGQGGFGDCLRGISAGGAADAVTEAARRGVPYFGICLGLQALFSGSAEAPEVRGLAHFDGTCERIAPGPEHKIPHMGWNRVEKSGAGHPVLERGGAYGSWFYFVHSYHALPADAALVSGSCSYGDAVVTAAVGRDNVVATQFHPEKSQASGLRLLEAFLRW